MEAISIRKTVGTEPGDVLVDFEAIKDGIQRGHLFIEGEGLQHTSSQRSGVVVGGCRLGLETHPLAKIITLTPTSAGVTLIRR